MAAGNTVTLIGNVTRDPELRFMNSGAALVNFGLAVNRRWQQDGEWQEEANFFDVTAWRDLAENVAETIEKGDRVIVDGRLQWRQWDDKDTGEKRSKIEVVADDVGPSLRWATAQITKNERRDDESSSRGSGRRGSGDGGSRRGGGGGRRGQAPEPDYDPNEEPF
jgi:single-strand DNA-binding protein